MRLRSLTVIVFILFVLTARAQIHDGATFLGGNLAFSSEKGTSSNNMDYKTNGVYLLPVYGKAIKENVVVGTDILYYSQNNDVALDFNDLKQWVYGIGFFIRQYHPIANTKFSIFVQGHLSAEIDKIKQAFNTPDKIETKISSLNLGIYPGISYSISKKLQLETGFVNLMGARYAHREYISGTVNPVTGSANSFNIYASLENQTRFTIGFRLLINKKERSVRQ